MYENLLRELMYCPDAEYGCSNCQYQKVLSCREKLMNEAVKAIEELSGLIDLYGGETGIKSLREYANKYWYTLAKIPRWIPVTEKLPEDRRDVQITVFWHDAWRTMYGYYDGEYWHLYDPMHTEVADVNVIGWMEKPSPMPLQELTKEET